MKFIPIVNGDWADLLLLHGAHCIAPILGLRRHKSEPLLILIWLQLTLLWIPHQSLCLPEQDQVGLDLQGEQATSRCLTSLPQFLRNR